MYYESKGSIPNATGYVRFDDENHSRLAWLELGSAGSEFGIVQVLGTYYF